MFPRSFGGRLPTRTRLSAGEKGGHKRYKIVGVSSIKEKGRVIPRRAPYLRVAIEEGPLQESQESWITTDVVRSSYPYEDRLEASRATTLRGLGVKS